MAQLDKDIQQLNKEEKKVSEIVNVKSAKSDGGDSLIAFIDINEAADPFSEDFNAAWGEKNVTPDQIFTLKKSSQGNCGCSIQ
mmetsp:Transcript_9033/g.11317  ORF Transcript_9033/g.11317 Transcript_9033/m.11317 type:complete len:83 (-) Transcript_9033:583-831(-)